MDNPTQQQPPYTPPPKREILIQGPRPAPLRVTKDSFKIKKPPKHPHQYHPPPQAAPPPPNQPVIIYSVSPKPYFVEASDFRSLVQHLTGRDTPAPSPVGEPPVSPAARLAAMERTSPSPRERDWRRSETGMETNMEAEFGMSMMSDMSQMPGILSPAPANLPVISAAMFSPAGAGEGQGGLFGLGELMSPFMSHTSFLPSPQSLFFCNAPIVSPSPNGEFFNIFDF